MCGNVETKSWTEFERVLNITISLSLSEKVKTNTVMHRNLSVYFALCILHNVHTILNDVAQDQS